MNATFYWTKKRSLCLSDMQAGNPSPRSSVAVAAMISEREGGRSARAEREDTPTRQSIRSKNWPCWRSFSWNLSSGTDNFVGDMSGMEIMGILWKTERTGLICFVIIYIFLLGDKSGHCGCKTVFFEFLAFSCISKSSFMSLRENLITKCRISQL